MLIHTFSHLRGIGIKREAALWNSGVLTWDDLLGKAPCYPFISHTLADQIADSRLALERHDVVYFARRLPLSEYWRLFPYCHDSVVYMDIECDHVGQPHELITTVALFDGRQIISYVNGIDLPKVVATLSRYRLWITFNGAQFDLPKLRRHCRLSAPALHIDLKKLFHHLGVQGGLKKLETQFGLDRGPLTGADGYAAVRLWRRFQLTQCGKSLETLRAYNVIDALHLERLMIAAYNLAVEQTPFSEQLKIAYPTTPANPFTADRDILAALGID